MKTHTAYVVLDKNGLMCDVHGDLSDAKMNLYWGTSGLKIKKIDFDSKEEIKSIINEDVSISWFNKIIGNL